MAQSSTLRWWPVGPGMIRLITAGMILYAVVLGCLVAGYARVSGCIASYAERSAASTAARADLAAQDRMLDEASRKAQQRADDAIDVFLCSLAGAPGQCKTIVQGEPRPTRQQAYAQLLAVRLDVSHERARISTQRAANEKERAAHPVPAPPSQTCGN